MCDIIFHLQTHKMASVKCPSMPACGQGEFSTSKPEFVTCSNCQRIAETHEYDFNGVLGLPAPDTRPIHLAGNGGPACGADMTDYRAGDHASVTCGNCKLTRAFKAVKS